MCICPLDRFGPRSYLHHEECASDPCLNNGTCQLTYDPNGQRTFLCLCSLQSYGDRCQHERAMVRIHLNMTETALVSVIQFCDVYAASLELLVQHQQLFQGLPRTIQYNHGLAKTPVLGLLKTYRDLVDLAYFILYIRLNTTEIHIISAPRKYPHARTLFNHSMLTHPEMNDIPIVFRYHSICRSDEELFCFYDLDYLCPCQPDHYRTDCFLHNLLIDQCDHCLSGGRCIRGDLNNPQNYLCICPTCYEGHRCEFSMEAFSATIDSLLTFDSFSIQLTYVMVSAVPVLLGLFNNICSWVTFQRSASRQLAAGNLFRITCVLNKVSPL